MIKELKIHPETRDEPNKIVDIDIAVILKIMDKLNEIISVVNEQEEKQDLKQAAELSNYDQKLTDKLYDQQKKIDFIMENTGKEFYKIASIGGFKEGQLNRKTLNQLYKEL